MPRVRRLDRYILKEILGPLALGFLVYTFILLLRFLFQSAEMIIRRGLPWATVGELLLVTLPNIVVLTIPMSLLFGILIAVGRLASDSELIAIRASGVGLARLYRPILLLAATLTTINVVLMIYALPWGNHSLQQLRLEIFTRSVSQQVQPRVFSEDWEGKVLYVFESPPNESRWKGVFLAEASSAGEENQITTAEWGEVRVDQQGERVVLELTDATRQKVNLASPARYEISRNKRLEMILEDQFLTNQRAKWASSKGVRELTIRELERLGRDRSATDEQRNLARVEIHKKFSIPAACLAFAFIALPLGINNRRGGKGSGFAMSIAVLGLYYVLLFNGEEAARYGKIPGWAAMWSPNIILTIVGLFLLVRRNRDKGLLFSRIDRWIRRDVWGSILRLRALRHRPAAAHSPAPEIPSATAAVSRSGDERGVVLRIPRVRLLFPNLLDRYVVRLFLVVLTIVSASGLSLYVIADLSERFDEILKNKIANDLVISYYKYMSLQIFYDIAPVIILVTTLMTFSLLSRTNEVTAAKALGVSLYRLALPVIVSALIVSSFCAYLETQVLPASNERVAQIRDRINGKDTVRTYRRADRQWLFGHGRFIYNYSYYDPKSQTLQRLHVFDFDPAHELVRRLYAENATYRGNGNWEFENGWSRTFDRSTVTNFTRFRGRRTVAFPETPEYFDAEIRPPEQMAYGELRDYVAELQASGQAVPELKVQLYNKLAFPVISLIMAVVALPFAFRIGRQGTLYAIGLSIMLGIIFLAVFAFFKTLGEAGAIPAAAAVWSPSAIFALLSSYLFLGVRT